MSGKHKDAAAIKLFGTTIPLQLAAGGCSSGKLDEKEVESTPKSNDQEHESHDSSSSTSTSDENSASTKNSNSNSMEQQRRQQQQGAANNDGQYDAKAMKKPDKILPCPRCKSMDTKFCYFNNYNVNQPRHFCKNCQRYWTAGGTMRNVPVGAGRRKSKSSALFHRITVDVVHPSSPVLSFDKPPPPPPPPPGPSASDAPSRCFPIPFLYPVAAYWSCAAPPGSWSGLPCLQPAPGKRSREDSETAALTMRIDDPEEAARSSMWTVAGGVKGVAAFQEKGDRVIKSHRPVLEAPLLLQSNPAALARSLNFQETYLAREEGSAAVLQFGRTKMMMT